jgi:Abortive infection C-terminus
MASFPNSVAIVVGDSIGYYYYHHVSLNRLFAEAGAPGDVPDGNCAEKATAWLKRTAADSRVDGLRVLGRILEEFMDTDIQRNYHFGNKHAEEQVRVAELLQREGFEYLRGGRVVQIGVTAPARQLDAILRERDLGGVHAEFQRALDSVHADPAAAVTAACAIVESLCKVYIGDHSLEMPTDQSIQPLWKIVQADLGLDPKSMPDNDLRQILSGLTSVIQGLGAFRTHVGSAHGRGRTGYKLAPRHANLVVSSAHTLATFIIQTWDEKSARS